MAERRYVYAIQARGTSLPARLAGFGGSEVYQVSHRRLSALTSAVDIGRIEPNAPNVLLHETVVESAGAQGDTLPVRFGTVLDSDDVVRKVLDEHHDVLLSDLGRLGNKVEMGVTVLWEPPQLSEQVYEPEQAATTGPGTRYLHSLLLKHRQESELRVTAQRLANEIDEIVGHFTLDRRQSVLPAPRLALRASYLLESRQIPAFLDAVDVLRSQQSGHRYLVNGPWPPYSFVTLSGTAGAEDMSERFLREAERLITAGVR